MRRRRLGSPRGAAAVEFALVLPALMLIVLGTIDWGYFFYVEQIVTNAAREGARAGSLTAYDPANPALDTTAEADAEDVATDYLTAAGLTGTPTVTATTGASVVVTVSYPTGSLTGFLDLVPILPAAASATAEMRR